MLHHRTKLIQIIVTGFPSSSPSRMCFHAYARIRTSKGCFREKKRGARYTEEKRSTNRLSAKCLVTTKCARAPLGRNQQFKNASCIHHCLVNVSPFPSASSRALYEETKNKEFRDTKPNLLFPLGTRRLSDSCSARVTLARVSSSCARDGEISISYQAILTYIIAFKRARAKRAKCV